jgi:hypothetical protein
MEVVADAQLPAVFPVREEVVPEVTEEVFMAEGVVRGNMEILSGPRLIFMEWGHHQIRKTEEKPYG